MSKAKKIADYKEFIAYYGKQAAYWEQRLKELDMPDTNQLPEPELGYIQTDKSNQPAFSARQMREALGRATQAVPMTDDERGEAYLKHTKSYEGYRSTFMRGVWAAEAHHDIKPKEQA